MKKHNWTAAMMVNLTDEEAAQAFTYGLHENKVNIKFSNEDGVVEIGCIDCELPYQEALNTNCLANSAGGEYEH